MGLSLIQQLAALPADDQEHFIASLSEDQAEALLASWSFHARPEQIPPGDVAWRWWLIVTGRGWGKNRTAAEWVVDRCEVFARANMPHLIGLIGQNNDDVKDVQLGGDSGLREVVKRRGHKWVGPASTLSPAIHIRRDDSTWHVSNIEVHTAMEPEGPRGRNFHTLWIDELAAFKHKVDTVGNTVFSNAELALRGRCPAGSRPQAVVTTTPKPVPVIRDLLAGKHGVTHITRGSMFDNAANLPQDFIDAVVGRYGGTRLAEQEIYGKVLDSVEGALWTADLIHRWRIAPDAVPALARIVIAVDPSGSEAGDECGIVVMGLGRELDAAGRQHLYVLDDLSVQNRPEIWGRIVAEAWQKYAGEDPARPAMVAAETNFGAAMVVDVIHLIEPAIPIQEVRASRAKRIRAEPVALMYDPGQGRCHHVGVLPRLEEQMAYWTPLDPTSPDRLDALVWGAVALIPDLTIPPSDFVKGFADQRLAA